MNFQGLGQETEPHLEKLIHSNVKHIARTTAEETEEFKQVITYVLITHKKHVFRALSQNSAFGRFTAIPFG